MQKVNLWYVAPLLLIITAIFAIAFSVFNRPVSAAMTSLGITPYTYRLPYTFFSATTTNATSTNQTGGGGYMSVMGAKKVTMYFTHGGAATTSTTGATFRVQTSPDGVTWNDFAKLIGPDLSSTATSTYAMQGATSTAVVSLDLSDDTFYAIRCLTKEFATPLATDGESSCAATAEF